MAARSYRYVAGQDCEFFSKGVAIKAAYQIADRKDSRALAQFLSREGQALLPMLELIEQAEMAVDELIDVPGRATIEAVLTLSAQEVAEPKHPGKSAGAIRWHGRQDGVVSLAERKVRISKPRLRQKGKRKSSEVEIPAYAAMRTHSRIGGRMLDILMRGASTRNYAQVLPEMAETVGVSKSQVSRKFVEASEQTLKELTERRFDGKDVLIVYIDGIVFGTHHVIVAIGVDSEGHKHVLGLQDGASENATVCTALLEDLVERGVKPDRRRLFVIDDSKALRKAIDAVYGTDNPVQRCRPPLSLVLDEDLEAVAADTNARLEGVFESAGDGHMSPQDRTSVVHELRCVYISLALYETPTLRSAAAAGTARLASGDGSAEKVFVAP